LIHLHFKETVSSLHTLWEAWKLSESLKLPNKGHILVSLIDSILDPSDWKRFLDRTQSLKANESLVLTSRFIDDEKPLYAWSGKDHKVTRFTAEPPPADTETQVTAGIYCLAAGVLPLLDQCVKTGQMHLRNFLQNLVDSKFPVYAFPVDKTIDIDRPEDVETANTFLKKGRSV
jgi:NDP-sugar pyrophosphorylase family protein